MKAELATHRAELEQTLRRELELLRESITGDILKEMRSMKRENATESKAKESKLQSSTERSPQTEDTVHASTAESDMPLLEKPAPVPAAPTTRAELTCIAKIVMSPKFDNLASLLVFGSVICLAVQTEWMARNFTSEPHFAFKCVEIGFTVVFSVEILLRLYVYGKAFFCEKNKWWNLFDLSLVSMQVTEVVAASIKNGQRLPFAPFLRCLRIARMVRVARFLRVVPELRTLMVQIFHSFLPLIWVFILVFLVTAVFAVVLTQVVTDYKVQHEEEYRETDGELEHLHQFDNLLYSMLSLYMTISEGKHWGELSEPLMEVSPWLAFLFIGYTFFVIFAFMNVVTSHFVEEALVSAKQDDRQQMLEKLEDIFGKSEKDNDVNSSELDEDQFLEVCNQKDMKVYLEHLLQRDEVSADEVKDMQLFRILDMDGSGRISTKELVQGCERLTRAPTVLDYEALRQMCTDFFVKVEDILQDKKAT